MYPHERSLVKQLADTPFSIVGVNSDDPEAAVAACKEKDLPWASFQNQQPDGTVIAEAWEITGWPTIFVIDANGIIRYKDLRGDAIDKAISELLAEAGHPVQLDGH